MMYAVVLLQADSIKLPQEIASVLSFPLLILFLFSWQNLLKLGQGVNKNGFALFCLLIYKTSHSEAFTQYYKYSLVTASLE